VARDTLTTISMTMENLAVARAIAWLESQIFYHSCFLSDSMSMLRKIKAGCIQREWLGYIERSSLTAVCFISVPGHAGVKGNERADRLVDMTVMQGGTVMDRTDILNVPRNNYRISEAAEDSESTTMIRLNELHVKAGSARQQQYAGKQRSIVNQHNTGIVSRYTFMDIIKEKSEQLWMCPMCNEDDLTTKLN
jgi:hypothetical protein